MKTIKQTYLISSSIDSVWDSLVNPKTIEKWGGGPAKMSGKEGATFSLWGGDVHGKNIMVVPGKKLVQEWFGGDWEKPSIVTFNLSEENGKTKLHLLHENVPDEEEKDIDKGWKIYYLGPIKKLLEH